MSPSESRSGSNPNRVRIFGPDKLVRAAAEKRWDRVKIVCSQPYSKVPGWELGAQGPQSWASMESQRAGRTGQPVSSGDQEEAGSQRSLKRVCDPSHR